MHRFEENQRVLFRKVFFAGIIVEVIQKSNARSLFSENDLILRIMLQTMVTIVLLFMENCQRFNYVILLPEKLSHNNGPR